MKGFDQVHVFLLLGLVEAAAVLCSHQGDKKNAVHLLG